MAAQVSPSEVRAWARENGYEVSSRGVEERVLALEEQVDSLTARLAEAAGTRRRGRRLRRS